MARVAGADGPELVLSGRECWLLDRVLTDAQRRYRRDTGAGWPPAVLAVAEAVRALAGTVKSNQVEPDGTSPVPSRGGSAMVYSMSTTDVAERLGMTPRAVAKHATQGALAGVQLQPGRRGSPYRFRPADVERFAAARGL